ncbi:acyl-CoA thioesterase [Arsenicicoccus sp. oral taxon 190]|uniref:acyl-CoA thioesterase n=1 Tax=Arsenicicoccus sp. oral taxon 190 TaxID=1658671 RepID=UPI00067A38E2|nr:acyl-CoA thioesterase [Arsenicicoccus sp. oral taxon 190]AKT51506.1 thioesterase [Arsenicicoccus sp. oral taxon 190]
MPDATSAYSVEVPLRWSDMDAYGHVNNVQYLRLLEEARVEGFRDWFGEHDPVLGRGVLVARSEIEYLLPLEFRHAPIAVDMWVSRLAGASYDLGYVIRDPERVGDRVYARAESTMVMYDFAEARPTRIAEEHRAVMRGYLGEPVPLRRRR